MKIGNEMNFGDRLASTQTIASSGNRWRLRGRIRKFLCEVSRIHVLREDMEAFVEARLRAASPAELELVSMASLVGS